MTDMTHLRAVPGFTLAELLIAMAILGVIATFTIPKVLQSQSDQKFKAIAKEAAGTVSQAYYVYKMSNTVSATTQIQHIFNNSLNYMRLDTTSTVDGSPNDASNTHACTGTNLCYKLHNGAIIWTYELWFDGTNNTNVVYFTLDPDGQQTNRKDSLTLMLYYDGKIRTWPSVISNSHCSDGNLGPNPTGDPSWFSWN